MVWDTSEALDPLVVVWLTSAVCLASDAFCTTCIRTNALFFPFALNCVMVHVCTTADSWLLSRLQRASLSTLPPAVCTITQLSGAEDVTPGVPPVALQSAALAPDELALPSWMTNFAPVQFHASPGQLSPA